MNDQIPNLDCQTQSDLMAFWHKHQSGRAYRDLGLAGRGAKRTTWDLANYASNKATAMSCRLRGDIQTALMYEDICDRIYAKLPRVAQW